MLFNSGVFLKFFAAFLLLYWLARHSLRYRNLLILLGSYVFYGWWDWRFLTLIWASTLLDYGVGLALDRESSPRRRKWFLLMSIGGNLSILGFFKYFNFFADSLETLLGGLGWTVNPFTLTVVLPVGISFYTFQTMSYTIDVYRGNMKPTRDILSFAAYVAFFPQLVAGPIERARHLLPQFEKPTTIKTADVEEGIWLILWGLFKKVVLADNLAPLVEMMFGPGAVASGPMIVLATVAFGFQIYCDFSGYSDIARGLARLLGFDIMVNFQLPYVACSLREFWRRWHISLSTWLRDYLYISLGGSRCGEFRTCRNLLITMFLGGLWHGAAWHFVLWGVFHGIGLAVWRQIPEPSRGPSRYVGWVATMAFVFYGWLLFRAESLDQIASMTAALPVLALPPWWGSFAINLLVFTAPLVVMELWQWRANNLLAPLTMSRWPKGILQGLLLMAILFFWEKTEVQFIYFQF